MKSVTANAEATPFNEGYRVISFAVALVLLVAAVLKGYQLATEPMLGPGLLDSRWLLIGVVEFELFFGLWLLAGIWPRLTWVAALGCFTLFTCVSLYKALSGYATCGCFGRVPVNPWYTSTLDLAIVLSLLRWRPKGRESLRGGWSWSSSCENGAIPLSGKRAAMVLAVWLLVGLPTGLAMAAPPPATVLSDAGDIIGNGKIVVLEPEKWIGKRFPLLDYIDIGDKLKEGNWHVLLYHHDCPKCQKTIRDLQEAGGHTDNRRIALIEMPPYGDEHSVFTGSRRIIMGRLNSVREWFAETPLSLMLVNSRILTVNPDDQGKNSRPVEEVERSMILQRTGTVTQANRSMASLVLAIQ